MARSRMCRCCKDFHDLDQAWPVDCYAHFGQQAERSGPQIISDTIEPFRHMGTGEIFSSKSRYRADLKARGLVELGNDRVTPQRREPPPVRDTLRQIKHQLWG